MISISWQHLAAFGVGVGDFFLFIKLLHPPTPLTALPALVNVAVLAYKPDAKRV